jgi:(E)-2-((N-methylformamido)methylene)succinate hydrolase
MSAESPTLEKHAVHRTDDGTAYSVIGAGEPVVLVHGVGMAQTVWKPQVDCLARKHQVIVYDLLGHGASRDPTPDVELAAYADQLAKLLDHLQIDQAAVIGHSMGSLITIDFALRHRSRARRIVAMNAVFERSPEQRATVQERVRALRTTGISSTLDATIARWFGDPIPTPLIPSANMVSNLLAQVHPNGYAIAYSVFARSDAVHSQSLAQLEVPALFMTGEFDPNSTPAMSRAMADRAPMGAYKQLDGARHMMTLTSADRVNHILQDFLAGHALPVEAP